MRQTLSEEFEHRDRIPIKSLIQTAILIRWGRISNRTSYSRNQSSHQAKIAWARDILGPKYSSLSDEDISKLLLSLKTIGEAAIELHQSKNQ